MVTYSSEQVINRVLSSLEHYVDKRRVIESIQKPWRENSQDWDSYLEECFPQKTFQISEKVNNQNKSYTFGVDLIRPRLMEELLSCEEKILKEIERLSAESGSKVFDFLESYISRKLNNNEQKTWGQFVEEISSNKFFGKLFKSKERWHITPIRLDSIYRILWRLIHP